MTFTPALAQGTNTTTPASAPTTPTAVTPSTTQVTSGASCTGQYANFFRDTTRTSYGIAVASTALDLAGLAAEAAAESGGVFTGAAAAAGVAQQVAAYTAVAADLVVQGVALDRSEESLPECDAEFAGTVTVTNGGTNVTGNSIYNNNLAVGGNVNAAGTITASKISTTQGISTNGGGIIIGDPGLNTYSSGITLGGGALSGAGVGGAQAFTGHASAVAIGNGARAESENTTSLGTGATATHASATAIGHGASAANGSATAIGAGASASRISSTALGHAALATGGQATALGVDAMASSASSTAIGHGARAAGASSTALGAGAVASLPGEMTFGTTTNTYTAPGITSSQSKARQSGRLELPTTDSAGHLASDGGETFRRIAANQAGIAIALAMEAPNVPSGKNFGLNIGWGNFNGRANAVGIGASGVVARDYFAKGDQLVINGGFGFGQSSFMGYTQSNITGGRLGLQWTW